jgi:glycerol kinase
MSDRFILSLDQGTTSSRAMLFDPSGSVCGVAQQEFTQHFPQPGWVEHDPEEIWSTQLATARQVITESGIRAQDIEAIGLTNQRETTLIWDRTTGEAIHPAIVWQDRRTAARCDALRNEGLEDLVRSRTGLVIDAYFSGTKAAWILDRVPGARSRAQAGELCFGTVDTWLIWKLSGGTVHRTDPTNASRTMLYDIHRGEWDPELCEKIGVPPSMLPMVSPSSGEFCSTNPALFDGVSLPLRGVAGDQQAALFGQACTAPGMAKNTYGTGCFLLMHTGKSPVRSQHGLITTIACGPRGEVAYALEGSIFIAGAAIQWLRDGLGLIADAAESEKLSAQVPDTHGVYVVPAFAGLGAPHWDMYARGAILGLTRGVDKRHLIRATLESIAYQTRDVLEAMQADAGLELQALRVDGGATANNLLMQFQADLLNCPVERPAVRETTALGAAYLAGLPSGFYRTETLAENWQVEHRFEPALPEADRELLYAGWRKAVSRTRNWEEPEVSEEQVK